MGDVHGDYQRRMQGQIVTLGNIYSGVFGNPVLADRMATGTQSFNRVDFDTKLATPTGDKNATRAFGSNCCVYLGKQAS